MDNRHSPSISWLGGFFLLILFGFVGIILSGLIGAVILSQATGDSFMNLDKTINNPANAGLLKLIQVISVVIGMLFPAILVARMLRKHPLSVIGYNVSPKIRQVIIVLAVMMLSLTVAATLAYFNKLIPLSPSIKARFDKMEMDYGDQVKMMLDLKTTGGLLLSYFIMAFLPALCEETFFRGGLQNFLSKHTRSPWISIIIISILFSLVHFSFYGFLSRMFLGIVLGILYQYSGSIWPSVIGHFFNNAIAVTQAFILTRSGKSIDAAMNEDYSNWWIGLAALPLLVIILYYYIKISTPLLQRDSIPEDGF